MKLNKAICLAGLMAVGSSNALAADLTITVQNLTQGIYFTPTLAAAHSPDASLFEVGEAAGPELQMMAEGGQIEALVGVLESINGNVGAGENGLTAPSMSRTFTLTNDEANTVLSVVAMMLPTNDAFIGLDNWTIPTEPGTYSVYLNAYDAGTEANDEIRGSGMPGMPGMPVPPPLEDLVYTGGTGVTTMENNQTVHIHRGNLGDESPTMGASDVSNVVHRWLNPVAKVTVTVN